MNGRSTHSKVGTYGISLCRFGQIEAQIRGYDVVVDFIAILTLVFTIIGAFAAVLAAFFAKGSATKADLERLERATAESVRQLDAVRAQHEEKMQREAQLALFDRASIAVEARGPSGEPLLFRLTLNDAGMELLRVDLLNADHTQSGSFACSPTDPSCFFAKVDHEALRNWFGASSEGSNGKRVQLRAHLRLDGQEGARIISADLNLIRQEKQTVWTLSGKS